MGVAHFRHLRYIRLPLTKVVRQFLPLCQFKYFLTCGDLSSMVLAAYFYILSMSSMYD